MPTTCLPFYTALIRLLNLSRGFNIPEGPECPQLSISMYLVPLFPALTIPGLEPSFQYFRWTCMAFTYDGNVLGAILHCLYSAAEPKPRL
jgi:hypothetical protein